jgi:hypothetical protein
MFFIQVTLLVTLLFTQTIARGADLRPIHTRPASTAENFYLDASVEYFDGLMMQEAIDIKGWTAALDFTVPFNDTMQIRFQLPVRTEAEGLLVLDGSEIDIEGWTGIYDYTALYFEHQLTGGGEEPGNFSYYVGLGFRASSLKTGTEDEFLHRGRTYHMGVRYDYQAEQGSSAYFLDTGLRTYAETDDLNPNSMSRDKFNMLIVRAGWFRPGISFTPGVEFVGDLGDDYSNFSLAPEIIWRSGDVFQAKLGLAVGLSPDAPDYGGVIEVSFNF